MFNFGQAQESQQESNFSSAPAKTSEHMGSEK